MVVLAIAFASGIALGDRFGPPSLACFAAATTCLGAGLLLGARRPRGQMACAGVAALALGAGAMAAPLERARSESLRGRVERTIDARVCSVQERQSFTQVDLCDVREALPGESPPARSLPRRVRLEVAREDFAGLPRANDFAVRVNERIRARVKLRTPRGLHNPGGRDRRRELARQGIGARARLSHPLLWVVLETPRRRFADPIAAARSEALRALEDAGPGSALVASLALGERRHLSTELRTAFSTLGLSHLLAVSGLHLLLVAGLVFALARRMLACSSGIARRGRVEPGALLLALGSAFFYAGFCAWGTPVRRALIFLAALACAQVLGRQRRGASLLALAALLLLTWNPATLFSLSAQLSFLATAGLLFARPSGLRGGLRGAIAAGLGTSGAALLATMPVLSSAGLGGGGVGLLTNLVAIPWVGFVLLPASLVGAAAAVVAAEVPALADPAAVLLRLAMLLADLSGAAALAAAESLSQSGLEFPSGSGARLGPWLVVSCTVLGLCATRLPLGRRVVAVVGMSVVLGWGDPFGGGAPQPPRLIALDVGQGDALLFQLPSAAVLVDAGRSRIGGPDLGRSVVIPALGALGVPELDIAVVTHGDIDHRGGMVAVIEALPVHELWLPRGASSDPDFLPLLRVAQRRGTRVLERGLGDPPAQLAGLTLTPLWPLRSRPSSRNEGSLVLRIESRELSVLMTGDIGIASERELIALGVPLGADILKVAHHGSRGSSASSFLAAVDPQIAIVSASCCSARLPAHDTLRRMKEQQTSLWWTGRDGAVFATLRAPLAVWGLSGD